LLPCPARLVHRNRSWGLALDFCESLRLQLRTISQFGLALINQQQQTLRIWLRGPQCLLYNWEHVDTPLSLGRSCTLHISSNMEHIIRISDTWKSFRETRLSALRPPTEFFDVHRFSRPADLNQATSRISYNTRYFSGMLMEGTVRAMN
jgi:hypothetical protein